MRTRANRGFTLGELVMVLVLVMLILLILRPCVKQIYERSDRLQCSGNIQQLARGMYIYAKEHTGEFPGTIKELYDGEYLADESFTDCPASAHKGTPQDPDYSYAPGLSVKSRSSEPLITDKKGNHSEGDNYLTVDGDVFWDKTPGA